MTLTGGHELHTHTHTIERGGAKSKVSAPSGRVRARLTGARARYLGVCAELMIKARARARDVAIIINHFVCLAYARARARRRPEFVCVCALLLPGGCVRSFNRQVKIEKRLFICLYVCARGVRLFVFACVCVCCCSLV